MRSSTLEQWQESRNNYLSIFSYVAINFNHSPTPHFHSPHPSQSKSLLNWIDKQLIRWRPGGAEAGKVIKGLQLLRAKRFQVNVAWDFAFCHSEDPGHTAVADRTSGARWAGKGHRWLGKATEGWTRIDGWTRLWGKMSLTKTVLQKRERKCLAIRSTCVEFMRIIELPGVLGQLSGPWWPILLELVVKKSSFSHFGQRVLTVARQPHSSPAQHWEWFIPHPQQLGYMAQNASCFDRYQSSWCLGQTLGLWFHQFLSTQHKWRKVS